MTSVKQEKKRPTPSEMMKLRHPELFSDSVGVDEPILSKELLDHVLENLSTDRRENEFENFARQLAEREICPNLVPQTGPVGGGDSKSDSVTHPTHPSFADRWCATSAEPTGSKRWAFAFSCKAQWSTKARHDVDGIAATERKPDVIYFITSRNARDKTKSALEDELSKKHKVPVHILDRKWIVDRVFSRGHEALAIRAFHLELPTRPSRELGPRDAERDATLTALKKKLESPHDNYRSDFLLAEDCIEAAELARSLGRPRHEVDGYLLHARRAADRFGLVEERILVRYVEAWTSFWWFNDVAVVDRNFDEIAALPEVAGVPIFLEKLSNLWMLLWQHDPNDASSLKVVQRRKWLSSALSTIEKNQAAPGGALYARVLRLHFDLIELNADTQAIFKKLRKTFSEGESNSNFPVDNLIDVFTALGEFIGELPGYDELFDWMSEATERRSGEIARGRVELKRGVTLCALGKEFEAVPHLIRARELLSKHDTLVGAARAMAALGRCYYQLGLLWAARAEATLAIGLFLRNGVGVADPAAKRLALHCATQLFWYELGLGRVAIALAVWQFGRGLERFVDQETLDSPAYADERTGQEVALGIYLAFLPHALLTRFTRLPSFLDKLGLHWAATSLLFALGRLDDIRGAFPEDPSDKAINAFFEKYYTQPALPALLAPPVLGLERNDVISTTAFGCTVQVRYENNAACMCVAEMALAAVESFAGAFEPFDALPLSPQLSINIATALLDQNPPRISTGESAIEIRVSAEFQKWMGEPANHAAIREWHGELVAHFASVVSLRDGVRAFKMAGERGAYGAPSTNVSAARVFEDIIGFERASLSVCVGDRDDNLLRNESWWSRERVAAALDKGTDESTARVRHDTVLNAGVVDLRAWRSADAHGMCYLVHPRSEQPPIFGPICRNPSGARAAFEVMRARATAVDEAGLIRIVFVENADRRGGYTVVVGADPQAAVPNEFHRGRRQVVTVTHTIPMNKSYGSEVLVPAFKAECAKFGAAFFVPFVAANDEYVPIEALNILIRQVVFRTIDDIEGAPPGDLDRGVLGPPRGRRRSGGGNTRARKKVKR